MSRFFTFWHYFRTLRYPLYALLAIGALVVVTLPPIAAFVVTLAAAQQIVVLFMADNKDLGKEIRENVLFLLLLGSFTMLAIMVYPTVSSKAMFNTMFCWITGVTFSIGGARIAYLTDKLYKQHKAYSDRNNH